MQDFARSVSNLHIVRAIHVLGGSILTRFFRFRALMLLVACMISVLYMGPGWSAPRELSTYAGGGTPQGRPASEWPLAIPMGMAKDAGGTIYLTDRGSHQIIKIHPDGSTRTIAGNGIEGFSGDGGPATSASLRQPHDVAVAEDGTIYIADYGNSRIRKVDTSGNISTIAGGVPTFITVEGVPSHALVVRSPSAVEMLPDGSIAFADSGMNTIVAINAAGEARRLAGTGAYGYSGDGGLATSARLSYPQGLAASPTGEVFIADTGNDMIRKVDTSGRISRVAGGGNTAGDDIDARETILNEPTALDMFSGSLFVSDTYHNRVRELRPDGTIGLVAGSGSACTDVRDDVPADQICLAFTRGVLALDDGSVSVSASVSMRVVRITAERAYHFAGSGMNTYLGDGLPARQALIMEPRGLGLGPDGSMYIAERQRGRVRRIAPDGLISTFAGTVPGFSGDGGSATQAMLRGPTGVTVAGDGSVYIADTDNRRVRRVDPSGTIHTLAGSDVWNNVRSGIPATQAMLYSPSDIAIGPDGNLYIAESVGVRRVDASGTIWTVAGDYNTGFAGDGGPALNARFRTISSIAFNSLGELFIADSGNHRIRKISLEGIITTVAGSGQTIAGDVPSQGTPATLAHLYNPTSVRVDDLDRIFISDTGNHQVHFVDSSGHIWTVAGGPFYDEKYGDGADARFGHLHYPSGLAISSSGDLYISDTDPTHWLIRMVEGPIS